MQTTLSPEEFEKGLAEYTLQEGLTDIEVQKLKRAIREKYPLKYGHYGQKPVSIKEFLEDPNLMNAGDVIYPKVMDELVVLNDPQNGFQEAVLTGGIGSAKTTISLYTQAYQLYLLSLYLEPHREFGLDPASEIEIVLQNINKELSVSVDYARFKEMIDRAPYFQQYFPYNRNILSKMIFRNRIEVVPVTGVSTATIGQNVIGGMIDEVNYMAIVEKSKSARGVDNETYDQAIALYNSIARRRESRFMKMGRMPGILCLSSSRRYPGEFTDQKIEEMKKEVERVGKSKIFLYDKRTWEIKPEGTYSGEMFQVFVGDQTRKPYILEDGEEYAAEDEHLIMDIPIEHLSEFEKDILNALREIAGVSIYAVHPFLLDVEAVNAAFGYHDSVMSREWVDFDTVKLHLRKENIRDPGIPRWVHVDLALTKDAAGLAIGHVPKFQHVTREGVSELMPLIRYDGMLQIRPPRNGEILYYKIRKLIRMLRDRGMNIKWVTFDSYQSVDSIQKLRREGMSTGRFSLDADTRGYDVLKSAFYDYRVEAPEHSIVQKELVSLEYDTKKAKVDHTPMSTKDVSDAMAGVAFGLTMWREVWAYHGISMRDIPASVIEAARGLVEAA